MWAQLVGAQQWSRLRLAVDALILSVTVALSLLAGPSIDRSYSESWVALLFGIAVLAMLHARPAPDDRLNASVAGDLQQRARRRVAGLDAHHLHRLDPRRQPSGGAGHPAVAVHRCLPRRRPRLPGHQPARGDPTRGPGHPDAHRRRGNDRRSAGPSAHLRAVLRAAAGRLSRRRSAPPLPAARPSHRPGPRHPRRPRGGDRLHRRAPCDPVLLQRARSRAGREGPPVPGARRQRLAGPASL